MDPKNIAALIVGVIVAVIMASTIMAPILSDASTIKETENNTYRYRMSELGDGTVTLNYDADAGQRYMNGEIPNYTTPTGSVNTDVAIVADTFIIISYGGAWFYYFVDDTTNTVVQIWSTATGANTAQATITGGLLTVTISDSTTFTAAYTKCYVPDNNGNYANCFNTTAGIVNLDSEIIAYDPYRTRCGVASGTIDDLDTTFHATDAVEDTDTYSFTATYTEEVKGNTALYKTGGTDLTYIVPYTYTYEETSPYANLFSAILVVTIIGIIVAAVSVFIRSDY